MKPSMIQTNHPPMILWTHSDNLLKGDFMDRFHRSGMALIIVIAVILVVVIFLSSYNFVARRESVRANHERLSETASILAYSAGENIFHQLNSKPDFFKFVVTPEFLKSLDCNDWKVPEDKIDVLINSINEYLSVFPDILGGVPKCHDLKIFLSDIEPIAPSTTNDQFQAGRDPAERSGLIKILITIDYLEQRKTAELQRQFRVVSLIPGPFARFTLFVPFTPWFFGYNAIGNNLNGALDDSYTHPVPGNERFFGPLKLINGVGNSNEKVDAIRQRGWVFLGPSVEDGENGPLVLQIPAGYAKNGGNFHFARPVANAKGEPIVPPGEIQDLPGMFNLDANGVELGSSFSGFFTTSKSGKSAAETGYWPDLVGIPKWQCASTWLFPYGDKENPSRTLIFGPAMIGFLRYHFLKASNGLWRIIIGNDPYVADKTVSRADFRVDSAHPQYQSEFSDPEKVLPLFNDIFSGGESAYNKTKPMVFHPSYSLPVSFNLMFDFMEYPSGRYVYPSLKGDSINIAGFLSQPFFNSFSNADIPDVDFMKNPEAPNPKGMHRFSGDSIRLLMNDNCLADVKNSYDNQYFKGNLKKFAFVSTSKAKNLIGRITHLIDLSYASKEDEDKIFAESVFVKKDGNFIPLFNGIILVRRNNANSESQGLSLPAPIKLDRSQIIVIDQGDLIIRGGIESPMVATYDGFAPRNLLTLVVVSGNIFLNTSEEIHAYLVALKEGAADGSGGKLLSSNSAARINVFGGVAVHEMALYQNGGPRTTMSDFPGGGVIKYNPRFNPSAEFVSDYRIFICGDKNDMVSLRGDK